MELFLTSKSLLSLREEIGDCTRCGLCQGRKNIVFGEGSLAAEVVFVGEAPGQTEDEEGRPFVGKSDVLLEKALKSSSWNREEIYIANIVKCRPPGNRDPLPEEIGTCSPFLFNQLKIIKPKLIVALGRVASEFLLQRPIKITKERGQVFSFPNWDEVKILPVFHPSYVLRNQKKEIIDSFYKDIAKAKELIEWHKENATAP